MGAMTTIQSATPATLAEPAAPTVDLGQVSILIPAYNEQVGIAHTLEMLCACPQLENTEIVVVDDGSNDETASVVRSFARARLVQHTANRGYGAAIVSGLRASRRDYVVWCDSDGQHRVEDVLAVAERLVQGQLEYVIGVRGAGSHQDSNRRFGKWLLKLAVRFAAGREVPDFNSGLRGFRRDVLSRYVHLLPKGFGASTLTTLLMAEGNHIGESVSIVAQERIGKSSVKQLRDGLRTLQIILRIVLLFKPMQFFGGIGALLILTGLVYGFAKALIVGLGFPVLAALVVILGVQAFFFGFLGEQISAIRRERFN